MSLQGGPPYGQVPAGQAPSGHVPHQPGQNQRPQDVRTYQPRTVQPHVRIEQPITQAPTLGQYFRSDSRGTPGLRRPRWAGLVAFWLGILSIPLLWIIGTAFEIHAFSSIAAALSAVAIFFGLVGFVAGIGRVLAFFGIVFALIGNVYFLSWLLTAFGN